MNHFKLYFLLLFLTLASLSQGAITRVQSASGSTGASTNTTFNVTLGAAPDISDNKYHYLLIAMTNSAGNALVASTADYSYVDIPLFGTNGNTHIWLGRVLTASPSTTITITTSSTAASSAIVVEYKSDNPLRWDKQANSTGSSTTTSTGTTAATANANELCFAAIGHRLQSASSTGTFTSPTNSYSEISAGGVATTINTAGSDREIDALEKFLTSTGTTTTGTTVTTSNNWWGEVATFEEVAAATTSVGTRIPSIGGG